MKTTRLFAFWRYDLFPYMLGAEVEEVLDNGWVSAKGYDGMRFNPIRVMDLASGRKLWGDVCKITKEYEQAQKKLRAEYVERLNERTADGFPPVK